MQISSQKDKVTQISISIRWLKAKCLNAVAAMLCYAK